MEHQRAAVHLEAADVLADIATEVVAGAGEVSAGVDLAALAGEAIQRWKAFPPPFASRASPVRR